VETVNLSSAYGDVSSSEMQNDLCGSLYGEVACGSQGMAVDHTGLDSGREGGWVQTVVVCGPGEGGGVWGDRREGRECCGRRICQEEARCREQRGMVVGEGGRQAGSLMTLN
jgi:hypothetical protein